MTAMKKASLRYGKWHKWQVGLSSRCLCPKAAGAERRHEPDNPDCRFSPEFEDNREDHSIDTASVIWRDLEYEICLDYEAEETAFFIVKWSTRPAGKGGPFNVKVRGCSETFTNSHRFHICDPSGEPFVEVDVQFDPDLE